MSHQCNSCTSCVSSVNQTLDELDFERGIWSAGKSFHLIKIVIFILIFYEFTSSLADIQV